MRIDRDMLFAVLCGLVAEGGLSLAIVGGAPSALAILLLAEATILGWVFGPRLGAIGAVVPMGCLYVAHLVLARLTGYGAETSAVGLLVAVSVVALVLWFCAFMAGSLRRSYGRPRSR